jgi:hypothetical protein
MTIQSEMGKSRILGLYLDYINSDEWRENNHKDIAVAAYYKAEARGFEPGKEMEDWLAAEAEIAQTHIPHEFFI